MKVLTSLSAPKQVVTREILGEPKTKRNIFFNQSITINELRNLGDIESIPEEYDQVSELKC